MPNLYTACWTMSDTIFANVANRTDALQNVAIAADTGLKIMGNNGGGGFSRMLVVPEYYFAAGGQISTRGEKHTIYKKLEDISAMVPDLIFIAGSIAYKKGFFSTDTYNVCPILHNGQIVKKLYKSNDDGVYQVNGTFRTKTDGNKGVPVATINGMTIGLDICMDYNNNRLNQYLQANAMGQPDIHVQVSGSNTTSATRCAAKVGGVYIHCDLGGRGVNGASAWRVNSYGGGMANTTRIQPDQVQMPGGNGRLMYFTTPV